MAKIRPKHVANYFYVSHVHYLVLRNYKKNYNFHFELDVHEFVHRDVIKNTANKIQIYRLTLRRLMSYIYMEHPFLMFLDHTQRRSTVGRTPLDE